MKQKWLAFILCLFLLPAPAGLADAAPPTISLGTLTALKVSLPRGLKLPVYTGPGWEYARAAKGKATASTNGWVQVFGREGDWLLILYSINDRQLRFGYVGTAGLRQDIGAEVDLALVWDSIPQTLRQSAAITDDPLASHAHLAQLPAGAEVLRLSQLGEWAYVQLQDDGRLLRGFVWDDALTPAAMPEDSSPFDLRPVSWGAMAADYTTRRYLYDEDVGRLTDEDLPAPNIWLRLDSRESRADLETLSDFRVISGNAVCARSLVPLHALDEESNEWLTLHFLPKDGFSRAALDITLEPGESMDSITIACTQTMADGRRQTITLPLAGLPQDSGYPQGGASFRALRYTPFAPTPQQMADYQSYSGSPATLGALLEDLSQPMPGAPSGLLSLPYDTEDAGLYLLEGTIQKAQGPFGVYDVMFRLDSPPPGLWLAAFQQCDSCSEMDAFDMIAGDVFLPKSLSDSRLEAFEQLPETLQRDFAILLLADHQGRDRDEIDRLIKELRITAVFSAEKWNMSYEQHLVTTAVGPRSEEPVSMQGLSTGEGTLHSLP